MSLDSLPIPTDMAYTNGLCNHSSMVSKSPKNKREIPCYACPRESQCEASSTECVAVRVWYYDGNYEDKDVARLIRKIK